MSRELDGSEPCKSWMLMDIYLIGMGWGLLGSVVCKYSSEILKQAQGNVF